MVAGDASRLPSSFVEKIRNIISFLQEMEDVTDLRAVPTWRAHRLSGDRKGVWSPTVSRNWRITFRVDVVEDEVFDLDFEDYH